MTFLKIEGMTCGHCVARVEKALRALDGAEGVKVNLAQGSAELKVNASEQAIRDAVADAGYAVTQVSEGSGVSLFTR